jgi:NTE family protein
MDQEHSMRKGERAAAAGPGPSKPKLPGRMVLVFQGGGALGAYQVGVYEALHEAKLEPDWVIGTSIGAINAAIIAANRVERRLERLAGFWQRIERGSNGMWPWLGHSHVSLETLMGGIPGFFTPNWAAAWNWQAAVGAEHAAFYRTDALRATLAEFVDLERLASHETRLTVGSVNLCSGAMRYFDSRDMPLRLEHVLGSSALPPAFPAIRIDGEPYWDGGIYSNTPIEAVFDDHPRRDSVIFAVQMWHARGPEPESIWQVLNRHKDIQYASRASSHIARQQQIHQLRHIVSELTARLPDSAKRTPEVEALAAYGCRTLMHVIELDAPRIDGEDHTRDIDFSPEGIRARRQAGYADTCRVLAGRPWETEIDPMMGVAVHQVQGTGA